MQHVLIGLVLLLVQLLYLKYAPPTRIDAFLLPFIMAIMMLEVLYVTFGLSVMAFWY